MKLKRVTVKAGRYYYIEDLAERAPNGRPKQKWHKLTRVDEGETALVKALAALVGESEQRTGNLPARLMDFRREHMPTLSHDVRKEYERMYDAVAKSFAAFDTEQVIPGDVLTFLRDNFADKLTAQGHYKARISTFFSWCVLKGYATANPCREIRVKKPPKRRGKMTAELYWRMHDALPEMGKAFLELAFLIAQRPTEPRLMRESWISGDWITIQPGKTLRTTGDEVRFRITPEIQAAIDRARAARPKRTVILLDRRRDPFILQTRDGTGFTKEGLNSMWIRAREKAGITVDVTTRDIRPFALKAMEDAGVPLDEIRKAAVHSTTTMTEHYLNQHRDRNSKARLQLPERKKG